MLLPKTQLHAACHGLYSHRGRRKGRKKGEEEERRGLGCGKGLPRLPGRQSGAANDQRDGEGAHDGAQ